VEEFIDRFNKISSGEEAMQLIDNTMQNVFHDSYIVYLFVDAETYEFVPARTIDKVLMRNVDDYIDQGVCAEAFTAGRTVFVFDTRRYKFKDDEALVLFPLIFSGVNYGVVMIVTKQDECKRVLNESRDDINAIFLVASKFIELYENYEKVREEKELFKRSDESLNNLMESVAHGIIVFDNNNVINIFNKNAEIMFGLDSAIVKGKKYRDVFPEKISRCFDILIQNTLIEGTIFDHETEIELTQNIKIPVGISTSVIKDSDGNVHGVVSICRDMTLTKEVNRLKEIDKMKSEFVSMVSHELKNPIAVIKSSVEIMLAARKLGKDLGPDFESRTLTTVNGEIDRLAEIINDLLSLSRIETGKVELNKQPTELGKMFDEIVMLFHVSEETHPITVRNHVTELIKLDVDKIKQVIINYINNAIKYSPNGSDIIITSSKDDKKVTITVEDKGIGIPVAAQKKVFDKFFRVASSQTTKIPGTGLGLAICKRIVELHQGKVWLKSKEGEGSTFGLDIPFSVINNETNGEADSETNNDNIDQQD
jgi:two-component system phosphate regulon sensor histidine kinase PhoR